MFVGVGFTVDTTKLESIIKNLDGNKELVGKELGEKGEGLTKMYAPVDTGLLRDSIRQAYPGGDIIAQVLLLGADCNYAWYQELGTYKMAAHPFFAPMTDDMNWVINNPGTWKRLFA